MASYVTSTARDPRGTGRDPLRVIWSHQTVDAVAYDVLTCGHRYYRTTETLPSREDTVAVEQERRCPHCVIPLDEAGYSDIYGDVYEEA